MSADAEALLRRFEPVVRSTKGDKFYPMDVEPYVRACSLWVQRPGEEAVCVVPQGKLDLDTLAQQPLDEAGAVHFLMFTDPRDLARPGSRGGRFRVLRPARRKGFQGVARGLQSRARQAGAGRVLLPLRGCPLLDHAACEGPGAGESAAAASVSYERIMEENEHYRYHGRVVRQDGWVVLQYWLFYPFNDWRSGFFGANDHEADWEKTSSTSPSPRRWARSTLSGSPTPPTTTRGTTSGDAGTTPRSRRSASTRWIFVGAGSHASYYAAGEYLTELNIPLPSPLARTASAVRGFWKEKLGQYMGETKREAATSTSHSSTTPGGMGCPSGRVARRRGTRHA